MREPIVFSVYETRWAETPLPDATTIEGIHQAFVSENEKIKRIRKHIRLWLVMGEEASTQKKSADQIKGSLPCITVGGTFSDDGRHNKNIVSYSGVVQIDIDVKNIVVYSVINELKEAVASLPFVAIAAISPTGCGIKGLALTTNTNPADHAQVVHKICELVEDAVRPLLEPLGIDVSSAVDCCGKTLSQPMYLTSDKNTYYNPDAIAYEFVPVDGWVGDSVEPKKTKKVPTKAGNVIRVVKTASVSNRPVDEQFKAINTFVGKMKARPKTKDHPEGGFRYSTLNSRVLIGFANRIGIDEDVIRNWMIGENWDDKDVARVADMYSRYEHVHGVGHDREVEVQAIIQEIPDEECLWIPAGGYLSDVLDGRTITKNTHVVAPTGSGKTHLQFEGKQIWVFPTTALCQQFSENKDAWTVWSDAPCPESSRDLIITTYDSFRRVAKSVDIGEYTVVLDEAHNFITSSKEDYKLVAMRTTLEWLPKAKLVITLTATPFPNQISVFADYDTIVVKKKDTFTRTVKLLASEESRRADVARRIVERGNFALIFLQKTDRATLIKWENELASKGKKAVFINSRTKGSQEFGDIVRRQQVDEGCVYVSTSVIAEGVSITTELDVVDVYILDSCHPFMVEQMSRRFRNLKELNVFLSTNTKNDVADKTVVDLEIAAAVCREKFGQIAVDMIEMFKRLGLALADTNINGAAVYEDAMGICKVDELLIENLIYQNECNLLLANKQLVMELLNKKYGYEVVDEIEVMDESAKSWYVGATTDEIKEIAKNVAVGKVFGKRFEEPTNEEFTDALRRYRKIVSKIVDGLPGITKLGQLKMKQVFDDFDVWNDKRSDWFITYVKTLNTGSEVRTKYRQLVMQNCVGVPLTSEDLLGYASILFDHEMLSASARKKSEFISAVLMAHEGKESTQRVVKKLPKINATNSGDVEVVGVEEVKGVVRTKTFTPVPERIAFEPDLMALDIFGYENELPVGRPVVLSDDEQFRKDVLAIGGFAF